jgi:hypothetical protein
VVGCIIAKLPLTWINFATSLKHKRNVFIIANLIGSLDVEEKARAKDTREKGVVVTSSANVVQKNNSNKSHNNKKKRKQDNLTKTNQTTNFKNKNKGNCFVCGDPGHFASEYENRKWKGNKNQQIWLLAKLQKHRGMIIYYLQIFQSVIHLNGGLIPMLIFMCVLIYHCFHLIRSEGLDPC